MKEKRIQINGEDTAYFIRDNGTVWSEKRNRELKGTLQRNDYHTVFLMHKGTQYTFMIHRLVAEAFCPNPNGYTIVHHKDGNKHNNCAENLEWVTSQENTVARAKNFNYRTFENKNMDPLKTWVPLSINNNYLINRDGEIANSKTLRLLYGGVRNGYVRVEINDKVYSVHRLVYETFVGPIPDKMEIDHIDGNRQNNCVDNLRLVTHSENIMNAMNNGHSGKIPVLQYDKQGNFIQEFDSIQAAADVIGVKHPAIRSAILRNGTSGGFYWKRKE